MKMKTSLFAAFLCLAACSPTEAQEDKAPASSLVPKETVKADAPASPAPQQEEKTSPSAASSTPAKLEGMEYPKARTAILGYGWKPLSGDCSGGGTDNTICGSYPETGNCSGTGVGYCDMMFVKEKRCLSLVTTGGPPGDGAFVDTVTFSAAPCSKNS